MAKQCTAAGFLLAWALYACNGQRDTEANKMEANDYRPVAHFTPDSGWMNDPNGMVFYNGVYHLFYQYYPDSTVWGPMHWGHATSTNLLQWQRQPIKLFPDSLGYIFSGSAVVDSLNTSGFGKNGAVPLVAIFTHHDAVKEKLGKKDHQNQSLAYSLDNGKTWQKYAGNPVLKTPGLQDFRDPKVFWYAPAKKWVMALAAGDRIMFYSSPNLKDWNKTGEFGKDAGAHGGVWECPDLFVLPAATSNGKAEEVWVLLVSINPGGPNGGSATQYFTGNFDGDNFIPHSTQTQWLDYGPDNYAGVTWSNTGADKIFIGWMSNWAYGQQVPATGWRSAMTFPRKLFAFKAAPNAGYQVGSLPLQAGKVTPLQHAQQVKPGVPLTLFSEKNIMPLPGRLLIELDSVNDFSIKFANRQQQYVSFAYQASANRFIMDRGQSGQVQFHPDFGKQAVLPRFSGAPRLKLEFVVDRGSLEVFADNGWSVATMLCFPDSGFSLVELHSSKGLKVVSAASAPLLPAITAAK
ncbi:MAG: glycoside hydrolase family 32 protein [Chitinophagaceae bacterium]|nr:glycoside hydrolase family 32 protein [Chitinophagaceae bacterium]